MEHEHGEEQFTRCVDSTDCLFYEDCEEHWTAICPGTCRWSTWFLSLVVWSVIGLFVVLIICLRCEFCPLNRLVCTTDTHNGQRRLPRFGGGANKRQVRRNKDLNSQVSNTNSAGAGNIPQSPSFHQVVVARSLSDTGSIPASAAFLA